MQEEEDIAVEENNEFGDSAVVFSENIQSDKEHVPIIFANLDIDDDDPGELSDDDSVGADFEDDEYVPYLNKNAPEPGGVQQQFVCRVQRRIQYEVSKKFPALNDPWLRKHLDKNDWKIRSEEAPLIAQKLSIQATNKAYYRDVHVWLPDVMWGLDFMPSCPNCKTNKDVAIHGFLENHFGRVVVGLEENFHVVSRRYKCKCCQQERAKLRKSVETFAQNSAVEGRVGKVNLKYTFMAWNMKLLPLLTDGRGDKFPAFLTWKAGVSKQLIDLMRPLFDCGVRPHKFSGLLLKLHSKKNTRRHLDHERELARNRRFKPNATSEEFSTFWNKLQYNGSVPTGRYIQHVLKIFHDSICSHLDNEVKNAELEFCTGVYPTRRQKTCANIEAIPSITDW